MGPRLLTSVVLAVGLSACAPRLLVRAEPSNALLTRPDGVQVTLPVELKLPKGKAVVTVEAPGYRPLTVNLREVTGPLRVLRSQVLEDGSGELRLVLVPEHGHAGASE